MSAALQAKWKLPVNFWSFGDGVGMLTLVCGGLRKEMADGVIF